MRKIFTTAVAVGVVSLASMSAPQPAQAADAWAGGWFAGIPNYGPGYGGPYYPYEWSYGNRPGYGYPYNYSPRYSFGLPYSYDTYRYADPYRYRVTFAWAGPPCVVTWVRDPVTWRSTRVCN